MNIFAVDNNPKKAAESLCDVHVVKMVLETAQLLSTAVCVVGEINHMKYGLYKPTHINHPSSIWARETRGNFEWLVYHGLSLSSEYTYRYGKTHASLPAIESASRFYFLFPDVPRTKFAMAMDKDLYRDNPVDAYRLYYHRKAGLLNRFSYKNREKPEWLQI